MTDLLDTYVEVSKILIEEFSKRKYGNFTTKIVMNEDESEVEYVNLIKNGVQVKIHGHKIRVYKGNDCIATSDTSAKNYHKNVADVILRLI